jgi:hypothetical protein
VQCLQKNEAFFLSESEHLARFFRSISTRLFKEDMLSGCKCFHSPFVMEAIWQLLS